MKSSFIEEYPSYPILLQNLIIDASLLPDSLAISASVKCVIASGFSSNADAIAFSALGNDGNKNSTSFI